MLPRNRHPLHYFSAIAVVAVMGVVVFFQHQQPPEQSQAAQKDPFPILIEVKFPKGEYEDPSARHNGYNWIAPKTILKFGCFSKPISSNDPEFDKAITEEAGTDGRNAGTTANNEGNMGARDIAVWGTGGGGGGWMKSLLGTDNEPVCNEENKYLTVLAVPDDGESFIPEEVQTTLAPNGKLTSVVVEVHHPLIISSITDDKGNSINNNSRTFLARIDGEEDSYGGLVGETKLLFFNASEGKHTIQLYYTGYEPFTQEVVVDYRKGTTKIPAVLKKNKIKYYNFSKYEKQSKDAQQYEQENLARIQQSKNPNYSALCQYNPRPGIIGSKPVTGLWGTKSLYPNGCGTAVNCPDGSAALILGGACSKADGWGWLDRTELVGCVPWRARTNDEYFLYSEEVQRQEEYVGMTAHNQSNTPYCGPSQCGNGTVESDLGEECDEGKEKNGADESGCTTICKKIQMKFAGNLSKSVSVCSIPKDQVYNNPASCGRGGSCSLLLDRDDQDLYSSDDPIIRKTAIPTILRPYVVGEGVQRRTQYMAIVTPPKLINGFKQTMDILLLGAKSNNPKTPILNDLINFRLPGDAARSDEFLISAIGEDSRFSRGKNLSSCATIHEADFKNHPVSILFINSNNEDIEKLNTIINEALTYKPLNEFSKLFEIKSISNPLPTECLQKTGAVSDQSTCAAAIRALSVGQCDKVWDLVVARTPGVSWRSLSNKVQFINTNQSLAQQSVVLVNAIGSITGLGDEFEYDDKVANYDRLTPNCFVGNNEMIPSFWKENLGRGSGLLQTQMIKGCGDFPSVGIRPTTQSIMNDPYKFIGTFNGFGLVNENILRNKFDSWR